MYCLLRLHKLITRYYLTCSQCYLWSSTLRTFHSYYYHYTYSNTRVSILESKARIIQIYYFWSLTLKNSKWTFWLWQIHKPVSGACGKCFLRQGLTWRYYTCCATAYIVCNSFGLTSFVIELWISIQEGFVEQLIIELDGMTWIYKWPLNNFTTEYLIILTRATL